MNEIITNVETIRGLVLAAPKKDLRYYLNGAFFDFADGRAAATDGHVLLAVNVSAQCADPAYSDAIIPRESLETVSRTGEKNDTVTIRYGEAGLTLARSNGLRVSCKPIGGRFPDYQRVIPASVSGEPAQFNPELLARISKALRLAVNPARNAASFIGYNGTGGAVITFPGHSNNAIAVIMPWTSDGATDVEVLAFWNKGTAGSHIVSK